MSLNDILPDDVAEEIAAVKPLVLSAIIRAASVGFTADALHTSASDIVKGAVVPLPSGLGQAKPKQINAWSFCSDHGQYNDTYGVTIARAAELKQLLLTNPDDAIAEINTIVTTALRQRGSNRPVVVSRAGLPGTGKTDHAPGTYGRPGAELKKEISRQSGLYGAYTFVAYDSGRPGTLRFCVRLGGGLVATHQNKAGAVDVARICRVHGFNYDLIAGAVAFWPKGHKPQFGSDIPANVDFDGRLKPGEKPPAEPVAKAKTEAPAAQK